MVEKLSSNWFIEGSFDKELKQYTLLAYLQYVEKFFSRLFLSPVLDDLNLHYKNLVIFKNKRESIKGTFPKSISGIDITKEKIYFQPNFEDDKYLKELDEIVNWSIPLMGKKIEDGDIIYQNIDKNVELEPVGIIPLNQEEGFLIIPNLSEKIVYLFQYNSTLFSLTADSKEVKGINITFLRTYPWSFKLTPEKIKRDLIVKIHSRLSLQQPINPATFSVKSNYSYPMVETLLPVIRKKLSSRLCQPLE